MSVKGTASRTIIGVMGSGEPLTAGERSVAYELGGAIARRGWVLLTGGSAIGVMDAASEGARDSGGLVIGVLRSADGAEASTHLDVAIRTGMGDARNAINVLSSDVVIALPGGPGTLSEIALALKSGRPVIVLGWEPGRALRVAGQGLLFDAATPGEALTLAKTLLGDM